MYRRSLAILTTLGMLLAATRSIAFDVDHVRIVEVNSFNSGGHIWVKTSGNTNCTIPSQWFIIERWDNQAEPLQTYRKQMYQMVMTAFALGKDIRVIGSSCYLNQYLSAEQVNVYE
jgi:hypothetical protein